MTGRSAATDDGIAHATARSIPAPRIQVRGTQFHRTEDRPF